MVQPAFPTAGPAHEARRGWDVSPEVLHIRGDKRRAPGSLKQSGNGLVFDNCARA